MMSLRTRATEPRLSCTAPCLDASSTLAALLLSWSDYQPVVKRKDLPSLWPLLLTYTHSRHICVSMARYLQWYASKHLIPRDQLSQSDTDPLS